MARLSSSAEFNYKSNWLLSWVTTKPLQHGWIFLVICIKYSSRWRPSEWHSFFLLVIHSQGSKNSDQSSGFLSGSGGSNSLPPSTNQIALEPPSHFVYKYGQARLDGLNDKFHAGQQKKGSLTSSVNEYSALSHHEQDMDYNGHKWV